LKFNSINELKVDQENNETYFVTTRKIKEKICTALNISNVVILFAAPQTGCFIGYANVKKNKINSEAGNKEYQEKLPITLKKICFLPFKDLDGIVNGFNDDESVSDFLDGQEIDAGAAQDVLCFMDDSNTKAKSGDCLNDQIKMLENHLNSETNYWNEDEDVGEDDEKDEGSRGSSYADKDGDDNDDMNKEDSDISQETGRNSTNKRHGYNDENILKNDRPQSDSSSSTGRESKQKIDHPRGNSDVSNIKPKHPRPFNMFDVTNMNYEQYVDRHYAIKYEQWFRENDDNMNDSIMAMNPNQGLMNPMALAMAMQMSQGGFYGQGMPVLNEMGMMGPGGPMGLGGLGGPMGQGGPGHMMDPNMFQRMSVHPNNHNGDNRQFNERGMGGRGGGGRGRERGGNF
jgi:hypothetical protein